MAKSYPTYMGEAPSDPNPFAFRPQRPEPFREGRHNYFEVCADIGKREYRYLLRRGYTGGTVHRDDEDHTDRCSLGLRPTNEIKKLVDQYIDATTFGQGILPVRNMSLRDKDGLKAGFRPLSRSEMYRFKRILQVLDSKRFRVSFLRKGKR